MPISGRKRFKQFEQLAGELVRGECQFMQDTKSGELVRVVDIRIVI